MPHVNNKFTDDYLDAALEKMRSVVRELRVGEARERAKVKLTEAARVFKELREEYDAVVAEVDTLRQRLEENGQWERRYRLLHGSIEDVIRGIIDVEELRALAREYESKQLEAVA